MSSWRALVLRIGEKCAEYGGNADYKDQLETCFGVVRRELLHAGDDILSCLVSLGYSIQMELYYYRFLLQCAEQLPHKIPLYGTLVGLLNLEDEDFVRKIVESTHSNLQAALDGGNCNRIRILMRFLTVLMCSKVLQPTSLVILFETLLSSAATTVDEDKGNPSWQSCADFYITCILSCLPWGGAELVEQVPEEMDRVMVGIQAYMSIRKHVSDSGCSPFERIDDRSQADGEKDFLEDLWSWIQDLSNKGWKLDSVPRPHLPFEPQLVAGKSHDFGPLNCPELPEPPAAVTGITNGKQKHEAELKYPQRIRRLNIFPASKIEDLQPIDRCFGGRSDKNFRLWLMSSKNWKQEIKVRVPRNRYMPENPSILQVLEVTVLDFYDLFPFCVSVSGARGYFSGVRILLVYVNWRIGQILFRSHVLIHFGRELLASRKECASAMVGLPVPFRYEYLMAETIFSQILLLPEPPFKPIYYTLVIMDLCKALPGAFPAVVAGAVRALFDKIAELDMECRTRLILWFSHHLSNFQFIWPWEEWAYVLDLPKWAPQRVFVQEVLEREVRLSYWEKIKQSIESAPALEELLPPKGTANFRYSAEDGDQTERRLSSELNGMVKERLTSREIISWIDDHLLPTHGLDITLRVVVQTLLNIGSKSFTHLITVLERYGQVFARICSDQDKQVMLISEMSSLWKNNAQMTAIAVDRMMGYRLLCNLAIVRWVFTTSEQFHVSDRPWEILRNAVNKTFNRITDLRKEILSLKKSVVLVSEAASKAQAELEDAKSKLTLALVDGEPVLAENPVKMKRLKSSADKTKEQEVSTIESLEAKEALFARAIDEIEAYTDGTLNLSGEAADEMAVDNEDTSEMELDKEGGRSQKSNTNGNRTGNGYNVGEKEQWCLTTLGYVKAFTRQYASETNVVGWSLRVVIYFMAAQGFLCFVIWPLVEKIDAEVLTDDVHPLLRKAIYSGLVMELTAVQCRSPLLLLTPENLFLLRKQNFRSSLPYRNYTSKLSRQKRFIISASSSSSSGPEGFSWLRLSQSITRGSHRFFQSLGDSVKKETGFDFEDVKVRVNEVSEKAQDKLEQLNSELLPQFISWNSWQLWKDIKNWEPKRLGVLVLYIFVTVFSCRSIYKAIRAPIIERERREMAESYMEALVPEPTPSNVRNGDCASQTWFLIEWNERCDTRCHGLRVGLTMQYVGFAGGVDIRVDLGAYVFSTLFKQGLWRKTTPKGLKLKKFVEGPDGTLVHDSSFVGENAWEDDTGNAQENIKEILDQEIKLKTEDKEVLKKDLGLSGLFLMLLFRFMQYFDFI
ncbi:hypothetical protein BUALT_Bualt03G0169800 [Buddleja alternifolia]|uniref:Nuclear cap-binding protein subunit 1 n=1 Tax=Buddleja alternifolia TaxID=168488 RepID=A0AAV6Y195_9LAMI|nr:hypothetical protein BUALT_Bualt03G0169800 [Buddleja alternifolia]